MKARQHLHLHPSESVALQIPRPALLSDDNGGERGTGARPEFHGKLPLGDSGGDLWVVDAVVVLPP